MATTAATVTIINDNDDSNGDKNNGEGNEIDCEYN